MFNFIYQLALQLSHNFGGVAAREVGHNHLIVGNLIWLVCTAFFGLYTILGDRKLERVYRATWKSVGAHLVLFPVYLILHHDNHFSNIFVLTFYALLVVGFAINRFIGTSLHVVVNERYRTLKKVALLGSGEVSSRLDDYLKYEKGVVFYGNLGGDECIYFDKSTLISESVASKLAAAAYAGVNEIYATVTLDRMEELHPLLEEADRQGIRLKFIPDLGLTTESNYDVSFFTNEFPIITLRPEPLEDIGNRFKKRIFDVIFSLCVIIFILSWLYPIIALLIRLESNGPALFKQQRSGRKNKPFYCYKFRSMKLNRESDHLQATKEDDRITAVGAFLRKTSMDELPQFFNVLMGHMSVVGPRPHMLSHTLKYKSVIDKFMVRHFVKPGITGWAQVHGYRGETKNVSDMENRVKYDIYYLENWTAMLDVRIVFTTMINMLRGEDNAY